MARHPDTAMEHLDRGGAEARPEFLAHQRMRYAVVMPIDIEVIIEGGAHTFPLGVDIRCRRQRPHRRPIQRLEHKAPGTGQLLERPLVQFDEQWPDGCVQLL